MAAEVSVTDLDQVHMTDPTVSHQSTDTLPADRYLGPKRYLIRCYCEVCETEFSWVTERPSSRNRPCPNPMCVEMRREAHAARAQRNFAKMMDEQRGPATIGDKPIVKAVDTTAAIVMEDHHMTNLRDNIREGDIVAPPLAPHLQRQADGYFNGEGLKSAVPGAGVGNAMSRRMQMIAKRALAGSYSSIAARPDAIQNAAGHTAGEPALRYVGKETLREEKRS